MIIYKIVKCNKENKPYYLHYKYYNIQNEIGITDGSTKDGFRYLNSQVVEVLEDFQDIPEVRVVRDPLDRKDLPELVLHPVRRLVKVLLRVSHGTDCVRPISCQTASEGPTEGESWNRLCQTYILSDG